MNEQPAPEVLFQGDWGCCPNKQMSKNSKVVPLCTACEFVNLYRFTLLANLNSAVSMLLFRVIARNKPHVNGRRKFLVGKHIVKCSGININSSFFI